MTPEYETWGQVLQFSIPEASTDPSGAVDSDGGCSRHMPRRRPVGALSPAVEEPVTDDRPPATPAIEGVPEPSPDRRLLDRHLQAALGRHLRTMFDDIANEPVPDRFRALLDALESKEKDR